MDNCIFCKIINKEFPALIIHEDDQIMSLISLEGHPLVIPKQHIVDVHSLDAETGAAIMAEAIKVANATKQALECDGINLFQSNGAAAGQVVFHFHMHIKPRWQNDGVKYSWDTSPAEEEKRKTVLDKIKANYS